MEGYGGTDGFTTALLEFQADPATPNGLLPAHLQQWDNDHKTQSLALALEIALEQCLRPQERQLVKRVYYEQEPQQDIAQALGIADSTVSRRLERTMKKLGHYLQFFEQTYTSMERTLGKEGLEAERY